MKKWEYYTERYDKVSLWDRSFDEMLERLGEDGWELAAMRDESSVEIGKRVVLVFKREKEED